MEPTRVATWNVNSLNARLPKDLWWTPLEDVICDPGSTGESRATGRPIAFGYTSIGKYLARVCDLLDSSTGSAVVRFFDRLGVGGGVRYDVELRAGDAFPGKPALFAQETVAVARSTFVDEPVGVEPTSGWLEVSSKVIESLPTVDGYNLSYLRDDATARRPMRKTRSSTPRCGCGSRPSASCSRCADAISNRTSSPKSKCSSRPRKAALE